MGSGTGRGDWINYRRFARVVKLVDTRDLKSRRLRAVPVRPRPRAPTPRLGEAKRGGRQVNRRFTESQSGSPI